MSANKYKPHLVCEGPFGKRHLQLNHKGRKLPDSSSGKTPWRFEGQRSAVVVPDSERHGVFPHEKTSRKQLSS